MAGGLGFEGLGRPVERSGSRHCLGDSWHLHEPLQHILAPQVGMWYHPSAEEGRGREEEAVPGGDGRCGSDGHFPSHTLEAESRFQNLRPCPGPKLFLLRTERPV